MGKQSRAKAKRRALRDNKLQHVATANYLSGMKALRNGRLDVALHLLAAEPQSSPCFVLAQGNVASIFFRLGKFQAAERIAGSVMALIERNGCPHPPSAVQFARTYAQAVSAQGRHVESFVLFNNVGGIANALAQRHSPFADDLEIEKAHAFNSWAMAHVHVRSYSTAEHIFRAARDIYAKHAGRNPTGRAQTLTNLAHALRLQGKVTEADYALNEALQIAQAERNGDQVTRVLVALAQLRSGSFDRVEHTKQILRGIQRDRERGRYASAYVRTCILAELAAEDGDHSLGLNHIRNAQQIEPHLDDRDVNPAKLRMTWARLLEQSGAIPAHVITKLIEGASLWFLRIADRLNGEDFYATTAEMHEHFRYLAHQLLIAGRVEDALLSFEAGRALAHSIEVDNRFLSHVIARNPFATDGSGVDLSRLREVQDGVGHNDALVSLAVLPPDIVGFVVTKNLVQEVRVPLPPDLAARDQLFEELGATPARLQERVGDRAIPVQCHAIARALVPTVGEKTIRAIMPYADLHNVPWRVVFRHAGMPWAQLESCVEFGLLLRADAAVQPLPSDCIALGAGSAGDLNLGDEARTFAKAVDANCIPTVPCVRGDLELALLKNAIVLVSCHGKARDSRRSRFGGIRDGELLLYFSDGTHVASELIPTSVRSPLVILSACESGVYEMSWGDFPVGAAAELIRRGARCCIGARFVLGAHFAATFFPQVGECLADGLTTAEAIATASASHEASGADLWRDLACIEIIAGPRGAEGARELSPGAAANIQP